MSTPLPYSLPRGARIALTALLVAACGSAAASLGSGGGGGEARTAGAPAARGLDALDLDRRSRIARLHAAAAHGLDPARYGADAIAEARRTGASAERIDALVREGLARLRSDLARGATPDVHRPAPYRVAEDAVPDTDELSAPSHGEYLRLVEWLAVYERRARDGGWPHPGPAPDTALRVGDVHPTVARLRARLAASTDPTEALAAGAGARSPDRFDEGLARAVRHAQGRYGLDVDGVVGTDTWAALAVPVEVRVAALRSALEHWRWLPDSFGAGTTLWVDVPSFELTVLEKGRSILDMPVVVGAPDTPTPPLVDTLESVVVHPEWNVPESILRGELAPAQAADPHHLTAGGYEVLDASGALVDPATVDWSRPSSWPAGLRVRQRSGPSNALGAIKFLFPNHHAVYLHDSPARHLYTRANRALSHGCVRLSDPWALAELLAERGVVRLDVGSARRAGVRRAVGVREPIPVFFTHFAARAEHSGRAPRFPRPFPGLDLSGAVDRP